jgi:hypothetical protein
VGGFVSILILIATLYYQGIFDITDQRLSGLIIFAIAGLITFVFFKYGMFPSIKKQQDKFLNLVDDLLKKVEKGEALPSLMELKKVARKKESKP